MHNRIALNFSTARLFLLTLVLGMDLHQEQTPSVAVLLRVARASRAANLWGCVLDLRPGFVGALRLVLAPNLAYL
jgi:hypothetical protein